MSKEFVLTGGWIYVMMTSADYNRFKLGRTKGNPMDRARTLRTGDPKLALEVAWFVPAKYAELSKIEAALHGQFAERIAFHDEGASEWFWGDAKWACEFIEDLLEDWSSHPVGDIFAIAEDRICRAYEADLESLYGPTAPLDPVSGIPW